MSRLLFITGVASIAVAACGSSPNDSLFGAAGASRNPDASASGSGGKPSTTGGISLSGGSSGAATGGSTGISAGGFGGVPTGGSDGGANGGAGGSTNAGGSTSAGGAAPGGTANGGTNGGGAGGTVSMDSGSPDSQPPPFGNPTPGVVFCGGSDCLLSGSPGGNYCCVGMPPVPTSCLPAVTGCTIQLGSATVACDDTADCHNGQICCGALSGSGAGAHCSNGCSGSSFQFCRTNRECQGQQRCRPIQGAPNYSRCE
jgi:hypothetical protein